MDGTRRLDCSHNSAAILGDLAIPTVHGSSPGSIALAGAYVPGEATVSTDQVTFRGETCGAHPDCARPPRHVIARVCQRLDAVTRCGGQSPRAVAGEDAAWAHPRPHG